MSLALLGATIYTGPADQPIRDGVIILRDGAIAAVGGKAQVTVPEEVRTIDCSGCTITAGFWNSHVHFFERKWADAATLPASELETQLKSAFARYGFTSVFDLSSQWENTRAIRDRIEAGEVAGPAIRSTGEGLIPPGALPADVVLRLMGTMKTALPEVERAEQASAACKKLLDAGVDGIKLFVSSQTGTTLPESAIESAASQAHGLGKPLFAHPNTGADVLAALRGGVDVIAHTTPNSGPWSDEILAAIRERRPALTPTLTLWQYFMRHDRASTQERCVQTAIAQLQQWIECAGTVLFGTDLGATDYDPSPEYALMAQAGMRADAILASLTTSPAGWFGDSRRGRIAPGLAADLVVLNGNPFQNICALASVRHTVRSGEIIYSA